MRSPNITLLQIGATLIACCFFAGCFSKSSDSNAKRDKKDEPGSGLEIDDRVSTGELIRDTSADEDKVPPELLALQNSQAKVAVKTFNLIDASFASVTGVPQANNTVRTIYADVATSLPSDNTIKSFSGANQVAIVKLAAGYCGVMIDDAALRTAVIGDTALNGTAADTLGGTEGEDLIKAMTKRFWGTAPENLAEDDATITELTDLLSQLANDGAITSMNAAKSMCTAILASAPVVIY